MTETTQRDPHEEHHLAEMIMITALTKIKRMGTATMKIQDICRDALSESRKILNGEPL